MLVSPYSEEEVRDYAVGFMSYSQEKDDISIRDFLPMTDGNKTVTGYYITFDDSNGPAGYLLLSLISGESPIVEFSFEGPGIVDFGVSAASFNGGSDVESLIFTGPGELYLHGSGNEHYSVYDHRTVADDVPPIISSRSSISAGILDWSEAGIKNSSVFKISNFGAGGDYWIVNDLTENAGCTPTAGTNILWYWAKKRGCGSIERKIPYPPVSDLDLARQIFKKLYKEMGTDPKNGTYRSGILPGFEAFFQSKPSSGGEWNYKRFDSGTPFSAFQSALNSNCPILLNIAGEEREDGSRPGHSVMAMGYAQNNSGTNYLMVMDGWNKYGRFIRKGYFPLENGDKIWVKN